MYVYVCITQGLEEKPKKKLSLVAIKVRRVSGYVALFVTSRQACGKDRNVATWFRVMW